MTSRNSPEGGGRDPGSRPGFGTGRVARPQCPGLSSNLYLPPTVRAGAGWRTRRAGGRAACELLRKGVRPKAAARGLQLAALPLSPPGPSRPEGPGTSNCRPARAVGKVPGLAPAAGPCCLQEEEVTCYPQQLVLRKLRQPARYNPPCRPPGRTEGSAHRRSGWPQGHDFLLSHCWGRPLLPAGSGWRPPILSAP